MCEGYSLGCSLSPLEPLNPTFWTFKHSNKQLVLPRTVTTTPNTFVSTTQIKSHPITPQLCKHFFFFCHCSQPCAPKHCLTTLPPPRHLPQSTHPPRHTILGPRGARGAPTAILHLYPTTKTQLIGVPLHVFTKGTI